jgi:hypothetical protein
VQEVQDRKAEMGSGWGWSRLSRRGREDGRLVEESTAGKDAA